MCPEKVVFVSSVDRYEDYYMLERNNGSDDCVVILHGHNAHGDQIYTREDLFPFRDFIREQHASIIAPNLRDNAWMNPAAAEDLKNILLHCRREYGFKRCIIASGSMGGTGGLIFSVLHPEFVDALVVAGGASSIERYCQWCRQGKLEIHADIADAICQGYDAESFKLHDVCANADRLTMILRYFHGTADEIMPVSEMYALQDCMKNTPNARFTPLENGDHDSPLSCLIPGVSEVLQLLRQ